jgi:hypothetical protein
MARPMSECSEPPLLPPEAWPWTLHEQPDRPIDANVCVCLEPCDGCVAALCAQAALRPRTPICLKTASDRILVDLALFCEAMTGDGIDTLLYVAGDRVVEWFVPADLRPRPHDLRWWSLTCHEDDEVLGRPHQRRRRPRRESAEARAVRQAEAVRELAGSPTARQLRPLGEVVAPERARFRSTIVAMAEWALARGRLLDRDLAALLLAAMDWGDIVDPRLLRRTDIYLLLWSHAHNWVVMKGGKEPDHLPETMWLYLDFLAETGRLHPDSDPLDALREPLQCFFGLDALGRPAEGVHRGAPCTCHVQHIGPRHGEIEAARGRGS